MSLNSSGSSEDVLGSCLDWRSYVYIGAGVGFTNIFLLPLLLLVLGVGYRRWIEASPGSIWSHADIFSYHDAVLQLISLVGFMVFCCGTLMNIDTAILVGMTLVNFAIPGQTLLRVLTCIESYVAAAHPITYRALKQGGGVRMRNISLGLSWLSCFGFIILIFTVHFVTVIILQSCFLSICLSVVSFCSLSVLCVLVRPGPGKGDERRRQVDQRRRRAFHTITAVLVALWFRFLGMLSSSFLLSLPNTEKTCAASSAVIFLALPGNVLLPLLFLHRAGKLPCSKCPKQSGQSHHP